MIIRSSWVLWALFFLVCLVVGWGIQWNIATGLLVVALVGKLWFKEIDHGPGYSNDDF